MIKIDASFLRAFWDCHELGRRQFVDRTFKSAGIEPLAPNIYFAFGGAFHTGVEMFWRGKTYQESLVAAIEKANAIDLTYLDPRQREKWDEMREYLPDLLAAYYDKFDQSEIENVAVAGASRSTKSNLRMGAAFRDDSPCSEKMIEYEWEREDFGGTLVGRLDRVHVRDSKFVLVDVKTATAIGKEWKSNLKNQYLRDIGLALYDWYLCQVGMMPALVQVEIAVKPRGVSSASIEIIDLPEITAYRERFAEQLKWKVRELLHYLNSYYDIGPWPMSDGARCVTKYGTCEFLRLCNYGDTPRNLKYYGPRKEHLAIRGSHD